MEYLNLALISLVSALIGYGISLLLSKITPVLVFLLPLFFTIIGAIFFFAAMYGDYGWGAIFLLVYAIFSFVIAGSNWIVSIILFIRIKKKSSENV